MIDRDELTEITKRTLSSYGARAQIFWDNTKDHDVSQNRNAILSHIKGAAPYTILDFGCGPGRDLKVFQELGHIPIGLDGCPIFCNMARKYATCEVLHQDFLNIHLPHNHFDGIFANASLFHVPKQELPRVLEALYNSLKSEGVLLTSNPRGKNEEGWEGECYGSFHDLEQWNKMLSNVGLKELEHYYRPTGKPRDEQPWLVTLHRKD